MPYEIIVNYMNYVYMNKMIVVFLIHMHVKRAWIHIRLNIHILLIFKNRAKYCRFI